MFAAVFALAFAGCGDASDSSGTGGTSGIAGNAGAGGMAGAGGEGGDSTAPRTLDQTCRDWCANEPAGISCHQGPVQSVQACYRLCLEDYELMVSVACGDEFQAFKDCQLELECNDLFGECEGACDLTGAMEACRQHCTRQDLIECVAQWDANGTCEFDDGWAACAAVCEPIGISNSTCAAHWEATGMCPPEPSQCGADRTIDPAFSSSVGSIVCDLLGVITVPMRVTLAARPMNDTINVGAPTTFALQIELAIEEDSVVDLGALIQTAAIGESSADVGDASGSGATTVAEAPVPCDVSFVQDTNDNGMPGPVEIVTPIAAASWSESEGSITLEITDVIFRISEPVPLTLTTSGIDPPCLFDTVPSLTFNVAP